MQKFDLGKCDIRELNQALHDVPADSSEQFHIINTNGKHSVAVGVNAPVSISVDGHVGYYCAGMNQHADITVNGNAGPGLAENIMSGSVRVKGNASQYCAATALRLSCHHRQSSYWCPSGWRHGQGTPWPVQTVHRNSCQRW